MIIFILIIMIIMIIMIIFILILVKREEKNRWSGSRPERRSRWRNSPKVLTHTF